MPWGSTVIVWWCIPILLRYRWQVGWWKLYLSKPQCSCGLARRGLLGIFRVCILSELGHGWGTALVSSHFTTASQWPCLVLIFCGKMELQLITLRAPGCRKLLFSSLVQLTQSAWGSDDVHTWLPAAATQCSGLTVKPYHNFMPPAFKFYVLDR